MSFDGSDALKGVEAEDENLSALRAGVYVVIGEDEDQDGVVML